ncbi:MAG: alpha/beta hydrolase [Lactobacillus sp.]|nr:alpha/beta hydrolase [Lactobacillus sp.]MBD5069208.1 alpha/beta hydrolase [Lactobacillus sp.]
MKLNKRGLLLVGLVLLALIGLAIPSYNWTQKNVKQMARLHNSQLSPVIMIPGSSASVNRFDALIKKINSRSQKKHSLLKVKVYNNGKITYSGKIQPKDNEPFIVVGFENNKDGYSNILKQAKMFDKAFNQLAKRYEFNNFKAFGHSNGGLIYTAFLEKYMSKYDVRAKILMTVGTPYNFSETSVQRKTQMLADFIKNRKNLPKDLSVYTVAGTKTYDSDGLVPEASVAAGKYIYQGVVKHFTQITVTGEDAQHSDLPQNDQIIELISRYVLDQQTQKSKKLKESN